MPANPFARSLFLHACLLLIAGASALGVTNANASPPPAWYRPPRDIRGPAHGGSVGPLDAPFEFINGTLTVGGKTCIGSVGASGCGSDYVATEALDVIDPGTPQQPGPIVRLMSARPDQTPSAWWDIYATEGQLGIADFAGGTVPFVIGSAPDSSFVLDPLGHVGLGTLQPASRLQVGPGSVAPLTAAASLTVEEGVTSAMAIKSNLGPEMFLYEDQNNGLIGTATNTPLGLNTNNQTRLWLAADGKVGIGTASAGARLQVGCGPNPPVSCVPASGPTLQVQEGVSSEIDVSSTSGPAMFFFINQGNGLMGTPTNTPFIIRSNNQNRIWVGADGKIGFNTNTPGHALEVAPTGAFGTPGAWTDGFTWNSSSSRNLKQDFTTTDGRAILAKVAALPVDSWSYKADDSGARHLGPTAEDFSAAFGLGSSDTSISAVDEGGVAFAAIKGLKQELEEKDAVISAQNERLATVEGRLAALEARMQ